MNLIIALLSSLLVVQGIPANKRDDIPHDSKIFIHAVETQLADPERLRRNPTELPLATSPSPITITTENVNFVTPKPVKAFEANDMEDSVVHPKDEDDDDNRTDNNNHYRKVPVEDETFGNEDFDQHSNSSPLKISGKLNSTPQRNNPASINSTAELPVGKITPYSDSTTYATATNQVNVGEVNSSKAPINLLVGSNEPLTLESRQEMVERNENILERLKNVQLPERSMPTGLIALVSAVGLATIAVMAYVGLIVWQRYQEYRHGNRELLVNDFDGNDISNFEL